MRYLLPYAFARTQQLLLVDDGANLTLLHSTASKASGLSEVQRKYADDALTLELVDDAELVQRISAAYASGESSAQQVVSEVQSDADLSRMMQAGVRRRCAHHSDVERPPHASRTGRRE
jgi:general secretion pathway protein E